VKLVGVGEGPRHNVKKTYRVYKEMGLQIRNKTPERCVKAKLRDDRHEAARPNETWAMDFVHDQLSTGREIRILTVVDTFTRLSPIIDPRFSYRAPDVIEALDQACAVVGYPKAIRVDPGSEFVSRELDLWAYAKGVTLDFSRPGKPTDNAFMFGRGDRPPGSIACPASPQTGGSGPNARTRVAIVAQTNGATWRLPQPC
jgi:putative transposase